MNRLSELSALALLAGLSACGSPEPAEKPDASAGIEMDGPYAASMMDMITAMTAAVGIDAADSWVEKMIPHHRGAIAMSRIVLDLDPTEDVARFARMTIENQSAEIEVLRKLDREGDPNPASAEIFERAIHEMHEAMTAASGSTPSETYLRKMLAHHRGTLAMSDIAQANDATGALRAQIEETRALQQAEIEMIEAILSGKPASMPAAAASGPTARSSAAATQSKPQPRASERSAPVAESSPTPTATAELDPHVGHDMDSM